MKITFAIEIFCRPEELFPWIAEPEKAMRWQKGVRGGEIIIETPEKIGTMFREEMEENGNRLVMHGEITDYIQDRLISFHLESKVHSVDASYSILWDDGHCMLAVESTIHWKFPMNVISLIIGRKMKEGIVRQTESELAELKRLCETNQAHKWNGGTLDHGDNTMPEIETRRLRLRPITMDDLFDLARLWADADVMRYLPTGEPRSVEETKVELRYMVNHWCELGFGVWAVILKETKGFLGYCGLQYLHEELGGVTEEALRGGTDVEVVAGLAKPYWGQGIAPEATRAALRYGFEVVGLSRVVAAIHPENEASRHILHQGMGMKVDESMHYYGDCPHFVIVREEFQVDDSLYVLRGAR